MPQKNPTRIERRTAIFCAHNSNRVGKDIPTFGALNVPVARFSAWTKISDTAKKPRIAGTNAMPAARSAKPKLNRFIPPTGS